MVEKQRISIIIPTYNESENIKVLLKQLFHQDSEIHYEVIIVDASESSDNLSDAVKGFPVRYITSDCTLRAIQLNKGARLAKNDILYFLHADAIPPKNFSAKIIESINNGFHFGFFRYEFDSNNIFLKINSYFSQYKAFYTGGGDQSCYIRKDVFQKIGAYNEELKLCEDFDLFDRLKAKSYKFEIINSKLKISSRKYDRANYFKVNWANFRILRRFRQGVPTDILRMQYQRMLDK